jgi:hypothetical protein
VPNRLGNAQAFFSEDPACGERAEFGMAPGKPATVLHGGQENATEALVEWHPLEGCYRLRDTVDCLTIVALVIVGSAEELVRSCLLDNFPGGQGKFKGTPGRDEGLLILPSNAAMQR